MAGRRRARNARRGLRPRPAATHRIAAMSAELHPGITRPRVSAGFVAIYAVGFTGLWVALLTPMLGTLAIRLRQIDALHAADSLARVLALGAACALIANPVFGHLSDHTRAAMGMRRPWMILGVLAGCAGLAMVAAARGEGALLAGWCVAQIGFNAALAAMLAVLPDQVPSEQRGRVSGVVAVCLPVGQALGSELVSRVAESGWLTLMVPGVLGSAAVLLFAHVLPDRRLDAESDRHDGLRVTLRQIRAQPGALTDFGWAWFSRCLLAMASSVLMIYLPFYLVDHLQHGLGKVPDLVARAVLLQASLVVASSLLCGGLSDLLARRKIFALIGGASYACGLWLVATAGSYESFLVGFALTGLAHGAYFGTDLALVTDILRRRTGNSGRDLGILNITNALPQVLAPPLGALVLGATAGGGYASLYLLAGACALAGTLAIAPLRTIR
jgi:MFS family permease